MVKIEDNHGVTKMRRMYTEVKNKLVTNKPDSTVISGLLFFLLLLRLFNTNFAGKTIMKFTLRSLFKLYCYARVSNYAC